MERRIEYCNHGCVRHYRLAGAHSHEVRWIVERRERRKLFDDLDHIIVDKNGFAELFTAVNYAVTYGVYLVHTAENTNFLIGKYVKDHLDSIGMILHVLLDFDRILPGGLILQKRAFDAYTLTKTLRNDFARVHIYELILERGASRIYDQNLHLHFSP